LDPFDDLWREHRAHVLNVAFRMLGNIGDAEDVVQEAFARLSRADLDEINDVRGWLIVVVGRLCLDHLGTARVRRERQYSPDSVPFTLAGGGDPAHRVTLDERVREAMAIVLQQLTPAERTVFVLHEVFQYPFDTISEVVGRSPAACRQLSSRARRHLEDVAPERAQFLEPETERRIADEFVLACASADLQRLLKLLDPDVVGHANVGGIALEQHGSERVAQNALRIFGNPAVALVTQPTGLFAFRNRELMAVLALETNNGLITHIEAVADPRLAST
jgi:RNA polymerase sigma-70 factor (ECF subfamily)